MGGGPLETTLDDLARLDRIAVSPAEAARLVGLGRTKIYESLNSGELPSCKIGRRRLIRIVDLVRWLEAHAVAPTSGQRNAQAQAAFQRQL
jgi:excisionase family DNA binding protein